MGNSKEQSASKTEPNPEKISPTANLAALLRTFSDIPYSLELAQVADSEEASTVIGADMAVIVLYAPYMEARFKAVSEAIEYVGINNMLEIASGVSPRGLIATRNPSVVYVESDLAQILKEKKALVSRILANGGEQRPNQHFHEANVLDEEQVLVASNMLSGPVAIISEGLFAYLPMDEKLVAARNIRQVLLNKGGVWITPDLYTRSTSADITGKPKMQAVVKQISASTGRDLQANTFEDESKITHFINEAGFDAEEISWSNVIGKLSSIEQLGADPEQILEMLKKRNVHILTPR